MTQKKVYFFGDGRAEGHATMKDLLGGKGANLAEMTNLGIPVPPGFTIVTDECKKYYKNSRKLSNELKDEALEHLKKIETLTQHRFGYADRPLLVSVRSGAPVSMPGMMDTVLNLGLNDETVSGLARASLNERFAYDSYRRFIQMYSNVVMGLNPQILEGLLQKKKKDLRIQKDTDLTSQDLKDLVLLFKDEVLKQTGISFPQDVCAQLWETISAVFDSWNLHRAISYRRIHKIPDDIGTAVTVQAMVFGNLGSSSATGVAFTRNPSTGEKRIFGEYLANAQGEDVVAGIRTPSPLSIKDKHVSTEKSLEELMPESFKQLMDVKEKLERHYQDMQDIEFTIQDRTLYLLQTRGGKRTAQAEVTIAVDMVHEGLIDAKTAVLRVNPNQINQLLHPRIDPKIPKRLLARGLAASPGAVSGKIVFDTEEAEAVHQNGEKCILVRRETSPEDINGMNAAVGILTTLGGMTSHAAVVARGMGKACIVGCSALEINEAQKNITFEDHVLSEGDIITIDGSSGEVYLGIVPTIEGEAGPEFLELMDWADGFRKMKVRANADTPQDARRARDFGAEGIGLCRTEHMFFEESRILAVREMILAQSQKEREKALEKIRPFQKEDFLGIFKAMEGLPVTVRLLDPPLHEFLPKDEHGIQSLSRDLNLSETEIRKRVLSLHEFNPMLGHRGCRLGISFPEIYDVQVKAIMEAACILKKDKVDVQPEIMIPLVAEAEEFIKIKKRVTRVCEDMMKTMDTRVSYLVGTMIELPRAALTASEIAAEADFFSFGTNDLTQTTYGISRDDAANFMFEYLDKGLFSHDPFVSLDQKGVGRLISLAVKEGRETNPGLKVGICGEHGGDPDSISFFFKQGLDYVSCSPFRVPVARLAAAHAALLSP